MLGEFSDQVWCAWNGDRRAVLGLSRELRSHGGEAELFFVVGYVEQSREEGTDHEGVLMAVFSRMPKQSAFVSLDWVIGSDFPEFIELLRVDQDALISVVVLRMNRGLDQKEGDTRKGYVFFQFREAGRNGLPVLHVHHSYLTHSLHDNGNRAQTIERSDWTGYFPMRPGPLARGSSGIIEIGVFSQVHPGPEGGSAVDLHLVDPDIMDLPEAFEPGPTVAKLFRNNRVRSFALQVGNIDRDPKFDMSHVRAEHIPRLMQSYFNWQARGDLGPRWVQGMLEKLRFQMMAASWVTKLSREVESETTAILKNMAEFAADRIVGILNVAKDGKGPPALLVGEASEGKNVYFEQESGQVHVTLVSVGDRIVFFDDTGRRFRVDGQPAGRFVTFEVTPGGELRYLADAYDQNSEVTKRMEIEARIDRGDEDADEGVPAVFADWFRKIGMKVDLANLAPLLGGVMQSLDLRMETESKLGFFSANSAAVTLARILFPDLPFEPEAQSLEIGKRDLLSRSLAAVGCAGAINVESDLTRQIEAIIRIWRLATDNNHRWALQKIVSMARDVSTHDATKLILESAVARLGKGAQLIWARGVDAVQFEGDLPRLLERDITRGQLAFDLERALTDLEFECTLVSIGRQSRPTMSAGPSAALPELDVLVRTFNKHIQTLETMVGTTAQEQADLGEFSALFQKFGNDRGKLARLNATIFSRYPGILTPSMAEETRALLEQCQAGQSSLWTRLRAHELANRLPDVAEEVKTVSRQELEAKPGYLNADRATQREIESITIVKKFVGEYDYFVAQARIVDPSGAVRPDLAKLLMLWPDNYLEVAEKAEELSNQFEPTQE